MFFFLMVSDFFFFFVAFAAKIISVCQGLNCEPMGPVEKPQGLLFGDPMIVVYVSLIYELTPTTKTEGFSHLVQFQARGGEAQKGCA